MQLNYWIATLLLTVTVIGVPLTIVLWFVGAIFCVIATVKSAEGERYRYPWIFRIIV